MHPMESGMGGHHVLFVASDSGLLTGTGTRCGFIHTRNNSPGLEPRECVEMTAKIG